MLLSVDTATPVVHSLPNRMRGWSLFAFAWFAVVAAAYAGPKAQPAPKQGTIYDTEPAAITVRGQAKDHDGRAIVGATVYLAMANGFGKFGYDAVLGQDVTDDQGRYEINTASLPVRMFPPNPEVVEGKFQVFSFAAGFGLSWHATRAYRPRPRTAEGGEPNMDRAYYDGEPIVNDLKFGPEAVIAGQVTDDLGRPLTDAKVQLGVIGDVRRPNGKMWRLELLPDEGDAPRDADRVFDRVTSLPEFFLSTRSDADGRFRIGGLPRNAQFLAQAMYRPDHRPATATIATTARAVQGAVSIGDGDEWNPVLTAPRAVFVQCLYADTGEPADHVTLHARGRQIQMAGGAAVTDVNGQAVLELTPDQYRLAAEPALGTPYLRGEHELKIQPMPLDQKIELLIQRGAVVEIQAIDADTRQAVPGVSIDYQADTSAVRLELQSQTVLVDHPVTDREGKLRAVVAPGKRTFSVSKTPHGYQSSEHHGFLELAAGTTTQVGFQLRRPDPDASPPEAPADDPREQRLHEQWRRQRSLSFRGAIRYRLCRTTIAGVSRDDLLGLMESFGFTPPTDLLERINERFPEWKLSFGGPYEMTIDGVKTRNVSLSAEDRQFAQPRTDVFNGREQIQYDPLNAQVTVGDRRYLHVYIDGWRDFAWWPMPPTAKGTTKIPRTISQSEGKITIDRSTIGLTNRLVADEQTGFVYQSSNYQKENGYARDEWQFAPRELETGSLVPALRVVAQSMHDTVNFIEVRVIDSLELREALPADAFTVAIPPGTLVLVYDDERPKQGMATGPVTDAVAFAEAISPRNRAVLPFLKPGQVVPPLAVGTWLDREGAVEAPVLTNKVVLIDFWGTSCGPCLAALPTVQAIAEKYGGTDLVVIGVHESGAAPGELIEFAKKQGLTYAQGIDVAADEPGWFGASFKAYGVRAIPHAALVDRRGRLVLIDHLPAVIERIEDELEKK